jgi:hypothetical protein
MTADGRTFEDDHTIPLEPVDEAEARGHSQGVPIEVMFRQSRQPALPDLAVDNVPCVGCGYNLHGLDAAGVCPECGMDIHRSLRGDMLVYSAPDYLESLSRGARLIYILLIIRVCMIVLGIGIGILMSITLASATTPTLPVGILILNGILAFCEIGIAGVMIVGWWWLSAPDPAIANQQKGDGLRQLVRYAILISGISAIISNALNVGGPAGGAPPMVVLNGLVSFVAIIMWVVAFFASMLYIRWIARRIPEDTIVKDAGRLMWLGPLLFTVGLLCVGLGPLIAFILYIRLIRMLRNELATVREEQIRRFG